MTSVTTKFTVERVTDDGEDVELELEITGKFQRQSGNGSCDAGQVLMGWSGDEKLADAGTVLTDREKERIEQQLYDELNEE